MVDLKMLAASLRLKVVEMAHNAKAAHVASALSCADVIATLYGAVLELDPDKPDWAMRDRFILSKGHAAAVLYAALSYKGYIAEIDLAGYGREGSLLEQHPCPKLPGVEAATGSLGHGLACGSGMALAARIKGLGYRTFVLLGDGECNEGSVWEAAMFAAANGLGNLCAFVDFNKWQATGRSREVLALDPLAEKFRSFGWIVHEIDGHDYGQILDAVKDISADAGRPTMVVAHTVKGKGVSFMEDDNNWHYRVPTVEEIAQVKTELGFQ